MEHEVVVKDLKITNIKFINSKSYREVIISWVANVGVGEYYLYQEYKDGKWIADTEHMDNPKDKTFTKQLFDAFIDELTIKG